MLVCFIHKDGGSALFEGDVIACSDRSIAATTGDVGGSGGKVSACCDF
ncbi:MULTISPECIES: hypothetical protein [unclassified Endozoicomonas]